MPVEKIILTLSITFFCYFSFAQNSMEKPNKSIGMELFNGMIIKMKPQISHLIRNHTNGFKLAFSRKTFGNEKWEQEYNYPDKGFTLIYLNYNNPSLGMTLGFLPHFNFYLLNNRQLKHQLQFKIGFGIGYTTKLYDKATNNRNVLISTRLSGGVLYKLSYEYKLNDIFLINTSTSLMHFSNGAIKLPNSGVNVVSINVGCNYLIDFNKKEYIKDLATPNQKKSIGYSFLLLGGGHEVITIRSGTKPFFVLSAIIDKFLNNKNRINVGIDCFYSASLKEEIKYNPSINKNATHNRLGIFLGHELIINEFSIVSNIGYYFYAPHHYFKNSYLRLSLRRTIGKHLFASIGVKSHLAKAEAMEFGIGYRIK